MRRAREAREPATLAIDRSFVGGACAKPSAVSIREHRRAVIARADRAAYVLARRLASTADPQTVHDRIVQAMTCVVNAELGALALYVLEDRALRIVSTAGYPHAIVEHVRMQPDQGIIGRVFASGRAFLRNVPAAGEQRPHRPRYRTESSIVIPLQHAGARLGVVSVADPLTRETFTAADVVAMRRLVPAAMLALERLASKRELDRVASAARVDAVTGLVNRRYLQNRLEAEIERAQRLNQPLATILLDVDDFKQVNDTFGHVEGDKLLWEIAQIVRDSVRIFDVCARYGGEEFAVLLPGATEAVVRQVAERVRRTVEEAFTDAVAGPRITVSAGVALLAPRDTAEQLVRRADAALLAAKAQGKNVVRFAAP